MHAYDTCYESTIENISHGKIIVKLMIALCKKYQVKKILLSDNSHIVIDKYNQVYPFQVSQESLAIWQQDFDNIEDIVKYHYENKDFTLPYELAMGYVKL